MNYRGPHREFTEAEDQELRAKPHGYSTCPVTGDMIIEELPGIRYDTNTVDIAEAMKTRSYTIPASKPKQSKFEQDIERRKKNYDSQGRYIQPHAFPKTILDNVKTVTETTVTKPVNEVLKFRKLIHDLK